MDKSEEFYVDARTLADDDLYELFAYADEHGDRVTALACNREITNRCRGIVTVTNVPGWLLWLPRSFWHTKPVGEGRGLTLSDTPEPSGFWVRLLRFLFE